MVHLGSQINNKNDSTVEMSIIKLKRMILWLMHWIKRWDDFMIDYYFTVNVKVIDLIDSVRYQETMRLEIERSQRNGCCYMYWCWYMYPDENRCKGKVKNQ